MAEKTVSQTNGVFRYLREVRGELRKVTWPTPEESRRLTLIVLVVTILFALFLFSFDLVFANLVEIIIEQLAGVS